MFTLLKYGTHLGIFATTFYFSYSGAEVQKMTLGDLFDNPIPYQENKESVIDEGVQRKLACLISNGTKQKQKCSPTKEGSYGENKPWIHEYPHMKLYPEVEKIFNDSWNSATQDDQIYFEGNKLMPPLMEWCSRKRREYITILDRRLLWHMSLLCSNDQMPFKRSK